ncbi:MAG TPA: peptide deformylase [Gemmatimonadaceae bacterium]|nr:peptide deformylase [Gemmatimonadaceae bacterium]
MALLDIHVLGSPILRRETQVVQQMTPELRQLITDMFDTMYAAKGIGLAAPQVGRIERIAVLDVDKEPIALINPVITTRSGKSRREEGCLSIPDIHFEVERAGKVVVQALDVDMMPIVLEGTELFGTCLQHEIDHLHGKLFLDHLSILKRRQAMREWDEERDQYPELIRRLTPEEIARLQAEDDELDQEAGASHRGDVR